MSGSSVCTILDEPQKSIGAQDIQRVGHCSKTGFLRRQGGLERIFKFLRWRQRFVVISRGCIYIYKNEFAGSPLKSMSLSLYNQVKRAEVQNPVWAFILLPIDTKVTKCMLFSCTSDEIRKEWMKDLRENMEKAHKVSTLAGNADIDDYVYLEKEIINVEKAAEPQPGAAEGTQEDDQIEEDYSTIDDVDVKTDKTLDKRAKRPTFKPALPAASYTPVDISKKTTKPKLKTPPSSPKTPKKGPAPKLNRALSAYEYEGTDRADVEKILMERPEGTFLVRKSRQDNRQVLSVNVEGVLKEFKIYDQNGKVTLDNSNYFKDLDTLIEEYTEQNLPKKSTKLYRAYSVTDTRYVN